MATRCAAKTRRGKRCRRRPTPGGEVCHAHGAERVGRPDGLTPEVHERVVQAARAGAYREQAAAAAGVSRSTLQRWLHRGDADAALARFQKFSADVRQAEATAAVHAVGVIRKAMAEGDWRAAAFFLERRDPQRWGRRTAHELTGPDGEPVTVRQETELDLRKLSEDELEQLQKLVERAHGA